MFSYLTLLDGITRRFLRQLRYLKALSRRTPRYTYRDVVVIAMATNNNNPEGVGASDREGEKTVWGTVKLSKKIVLKGWQEAFNQITVEQ